MLNIQFPIHLSPDVRASIADRLVVTESEPLLVLVQTGGVEKVGGLIDGPIPTRARVTAFFVG